MTVEEIIDQVKQYHYPLVEITGGEPLLQSETPRLAESLLSEGHTVLVETNGTQNIDRLPGDVIRVVDIKTPSSGESDRTDWDNLKRISPKDEIKFVLSDRADYLWTRQIMNQYDLSGRGNILFSLVRNQLNPSEAAEWILEDQLPVRLQLQLHKIIWPDDERGK